MAKENTAVEQKELSVPIEVTVKPIEPQGNLYGFASVKVGGITMKDFKIVANKDGELFVSMPSRADNKTQSGYRNTVFVDKEFMEAFNGAVVDAYHTAVEKVQDRAAAIKGDKPPIAEQLGKAAAEAAAHNAAKPPTHKPPDLGDRD